MTSIRKHFFFCKSMQKPIESEMRGTVLSIIRAGNDHYITLLLRGPESVVPGISRKESWPRARIKRENTPADINAWRTQLQHTYMCYYNRSRTGRVLIPIENISVWKLSRSQHSQVRNQCLPMHWGIMWKVGVPHWASATQLNSDLLRKYISRPQWELKWCRGWGLNSFTDSIIKQTTHRGTSTGWFKRKNSNLDGAKHKQHHLNKQKMYATKQGSTGLNEVD